ncbi:MAG: flagellar basal body rod protein FlgG [Candidatus Hydrogenedentota bacterium]
MIRALFTASTGMVAQQLNVDTVANNLANVNTTAFKKSRVNFKDLIYETLKAPGSPNSAGEITPEGVQVGHGVRVGSVAKIFTPGNMISTGTPTDLAIEGEGFFQLELPDGTTAYTRDGNFKINANGTMVTVDGYILSPTITVPTDYTSITIGNDGVVSVEVPGQTGATEVGTLQLVRFPNPAGLNAKLGRNLLLETEASGTPVTGEPGVDGVGFLNQGFLENSNVQVVEEILNLIIAQRAYEANSRVITTSDEMLQTANQIRR